MNHVYIGIDPAFRKDGFTIAIVDEERSVEFRSFRNGFHDFLGWLTNDCPEHAVFGIENSNLQKKVFKQTINRAVSVGKNQVASQYTVDACKLHYPDTTFEWSPKAKGKKPTPAEILIYCQLNKWTLSKKRTNQDERDALKMAHLVFHHYKIIQHRKK